MKTDQSAKGKRTVQAHAILYLAIELSNTKWKLAFSNGSKIGLLQLMHGI